MLIVNTDASGKREKPNFLIGYVIHKDNEVIKKDVKEINISKEIDSKKVNETIYLELLSVIFALEEILKSHLYKVDKIQIYNDNTTVVYILNRLFINKRKITKIEKVLKVELEKSKDILSKIGYVKFKYINSKDNKAHNLLENYRKACKVYVKFMLLRKWEQDINELEIEKIEEGQFIVTTLEGSKFIVNLLKETCSCKYFYYNQEVCKHIIACKRYK